MKLVLAMLASILFASPVFAQHSHGAKGPNGGDTQDVAGIEVELVATGNTITLYVTDDDHKPVAAKSLTASALITAPGTQEPVKLESAGENVLKGTSKAAIGAGVTVTIMIKTAAGKSGQVRFKK